MLTWQVGATLALSVCGRYGVTYLKKKATFITISFKERKNNLAIKLITINHCYMKLLKYLNFGAWGREEVFTGFGWEAQREETTEKT
jgi:hypothetical protein